MIYQSSLPGVFSYRWSFLSKLNINFVGVRRRMPPFVIAKPHASSEVIVPEGYEIQMTLTSLTPETKNLMFDSINNPVKSYDESELTKLNVYEHAPVDEDDTHSQRYEMGGSDYGESASAGTEQSSRRPTDGSD